MMTNGNKGQMRIIEAILASFIIIFALSFANIFAITPTSPKYEVTELQKLGYNVLHDLDEQALLARFIYNGEWDNITAALRVMLPLEVYFNMTVYELQDNSSRAINNATIFYGDIETFITSKNIASVTYGLAGYATKINGGTYQAIYDPRILILQLVRG